MNIFPSTNNDDKWIATCIAQTFSLIAAWHYMSTEFTAYHRIVTVEQLITQFSNFHRGHVVCCEIRQDFGISQRSIQRFTSGQAWVCWPGFVFFAVNPNILEWKSSPTAGHVVWNAVTDVFLLDVSNNIHQLILIINVHCFVSIDINNRLNARPRSGHEP